MRTVKLLIIEDDETQMKSYGDSIDRYNQENDEFEIIRYEIFDIEEGIKEIKTLKYDCVQVDLKFGGTDMEGRGNEALDIIVNELRIPVVVISGYLDDLDEKYQGSSNPFIMTYDRGYDYDKILEKIMSIYKLGITKMLGQNGLIEKYITEIFWTHLANDADYWLENIEIIERFDHVVLRYLITYLHEYLDINEDGDLEMYHKTEMYIIPPIKNNVFTGDILYSEDKERHYIVLTPACDLANKKAKMVLICHIDKLTEDPINQNKKNILHEKEDIRIEAKNNLKRLLGNNFSLKYHFLAPTTSFEGGLVNFQKISTILIKDIEDKDIYIRVASISNLFIKDIIARFSNYYSRQGQPNINIDNIYNEMIEN